MVSEEEEGAKRQPHTSPEHRARVARTWSSSRSRSRTSSRRRRGPSTSRSRFPGAKVDARAHATMRNGRTVFVLFFILSFEPYFSLFSFYLYFLLYFLCIFYWFSFIECACTGPRNDAGTEPLFFSFLYISIFLFSLVL